MLLSCNIWHLQWPGMCSSHTSYTGYPDGNKLGLHPRAGLPWSALVHLLVCWLINKRGNVQHLSYPGAAVLDWGLPQTPGVSANCTVPPCSSCSLEPAWARQVTEQLLTKHGNVWLTNAPISKCPADAAGVSQRLPKSPRDSATTAKSSTSSLHVWPHKACLSQKKRVQHFSKDY